MLKQRAQPFFCWFVLCTMGAGLAAAQDRVVLENGLIRLSFDKANGQFEIYSLTEGFLRLREAGPAIEIDGQMLSSSKLDRVEARRERFEDRLGRGEKLIAMYSFRDKAPGFRYELSLYQDRPWVSVTAYLAPGNYRLGDVSLIQGKLRVPEAFRTRLYVCSGTAGGNSGVWDLGMRQWNSAALSVYYDPRVREALHLGFYSFYRASTSVQSQYLGADTIGVNAVAHYKGYRPQPEELRSESLLMMLGPDPLRMLEDWAEAAASMVQPKFIRDTRRGFINTWNMYGDEITEDDEIKQAKLLRQTILPAYGIDIVDTGEWQVQRHEIGDAGDALGYGEDQEDRRLYPHGLGWLTEQLRGLGFDVTFGANYAYAASEVTIAKKNVPWLVREDHSRSSYGYPIDFTHPGAKKWLSDLSRRVVEYKAVEWWTDFDGGPTRGRLYDPTKIMGFEDIREGMRVTREAIGQNVMVHRYCCGPYFTYIGLADRVRTGNDACAMGNFEGLKESARQLAATFMLHQRFWVNDPDPVLVGGRDYVHNDGAGPIGPDPAILDEVRMRLQFHASTGSFLTLGENLEDLDAERIHLLTLVLPSLGQAARPLDLFLHNTPEIYDLKVQTTWDTWHIVFLQNWNDWRKTYDLHFSDLDLDANKPYLVFGFWGQAFLGEFRSQAALEVAGRKGETYAIREVPPHPWVISTDLHLTQGGVDLEGVRYDESSGQLSGTARRHAGARGHVVIYVPAGYKIRTASGPMTADPQPSGAVIAHLELKFDAATAPWVISFEKTE